MYVGLSTAVRSCYSDFSNYTAAAFPNLTCSRSVSVYNWDFETFPSDSNASVKDCDARIIEESLATRNRRTATCVALVFFLVLIVAASLWFYFRRADEERRRWRFDVDANIEKGPHQFSHKELRLATKGFSPKQTLGRGGFGGVYKGFLPGSRVEVAVKRVAPDSKQGEKEFLAEVQIIGKIRHRHLVRLQGWCHERGELLLVYDYLSGGSLDKFLFKDKDDLTQNNDNVTLFSWENRWKQSRALQQQWPTCTKSVTSVSCTETSRASNVMLDANMNARLGDFGLARSYQHSMLAPESTVVAGTLG